MIVFVDESGFSQRPCRVATWAPRGHTPVIQYHFNWDQLSVIAGLTRWNCYFRMHQGAIDRFLVVEFLKALVRTIKRPLLILWDSLPAHCQEEPKFPQIWECKVPHPVHASASSVRTRPAFNFSLSRYELPRMLSVTA